LLHRHIRTEVEHGTDNDSNANLANDFELASKTGFVLFEDFEY
jgi:hypothetical protein